jgi:tetratricopeptide (TPR) repeat protein
MTLIDQGRLAEVDSLGKAVRGFAKTWKDKEARGRFYSQMSSGMAQAGVFAQAVADADSAIALLPDRWWVYSGRANVNKLMQNRAGMEADCRKCAEMEVTEPEQLRNRAFTLRNVCNRLDLALRDFNRLVEIAPWWADAHKVRGDYYRGENQHELAIQDYSKAIELAPKWAVLYNNRGLVHQYNLEDFEKALADYDRFLELGNDAVYLRDNRAQAYLRLGKIDEAFAELDRIGELQPQSARMDRERSGKGTG